MIKSAVFSLNTVVYQPRFSMKGEQEGNVYKNRANFLVNVPVFSRVNETETRRKAAQTSGYYKNNYILTMDQFELFTLNCTPFRRMAEFLEADETIVAVKIQLKLKLLARRSLKR